MKKVFAMFLYVLAISIILIGYFIGGVILTYVYLTLSAVDIIDTFVDNGRSALSKIFKVPKVSIEY